MLKNMILVLGASGYIGQAFLEELRRRGMDSLPLSRREVDYSCFRSLVNFLERRRPELIINAAGYTGRPNVDACELHRAETLHGNAVMPHTVALAAQVAGVALAHISTGCIYNGARVLRNGSWETVADLTRPDIVELFDRAPESFAGFTEDDAPNFSFRAPPCSFYSGTKALAEELVAGENTWIWRTRLPFDEFDGSRNLLSKLLRYPRIYRNINSLSHRGDFVRACLDLWSAKASPGIYNVANPGAVSTGRLIGMIQQTLRPSREFSFWNNDAEFYASGAVAPRSNCILDVSKLLRAGVSLRPVEHALQDTLDRWQGESPRGVI